MESKTKFVERCDAVRIEVMIVDEQHFCETSLPAIGIGVVCQVYDWDSVVWL